MIIGGFTSRNTNKSNKSHRVSRGGYATNIFDRALGNFSPLITDSSAENRGETITSG